MNPTDAQIQEDNLRSLVVREGWGAVLAELTRLRARAESAEVERDGYKQSANHHRDLGITLLDAKYLDPACHKGCQSLVHQRERDALADHNAKLREAAADFAENVKRHNVAGFAEVHVATDASFREFVKALATTPADCAKELTELREKVAADEKEIQRLHGIIDGMAMLASGYAP